MALSILAGLPFRMLQIISGILLVPLAFRYLGEARFGLWAALTALAPLITLADFGLGQGLVTPLSNNLSHDERRSAQHQICGTLLLVTGLALTLILLLIAGQGLSSDAWAAWFNIHDPRLKVDVKPTVFIVSLTALCLMPLGLAGKIRAAFQESFATSAWDSVGVIAGLAGFIAVTVLGGSLSALALALMAPPLATNAANWWGLLRRHPWLRTGVRHLRYRDIVTLVQPVIRLGFMFFSLTVAALITSASDSFIALQLSGPEAAAKIALAAKLYGAGQAILYAALAPLWPAFAEAIARQDRPWIARALFRSTAITFIASLILAFGITLIANPALHLVIGQATDLPPALLWANAASLMVFTLVNTFGMLLNGAGIIKIQILTAVFYSVLGLFLKFFLPGILGISGIVWATSIAYCLTTLPVYIRASRRLYA